jgi:hypothetical protein
MKWCVVSVNDHQGYRNPAKGPARLRVTSCDNMKEPSQ